ncbi:hypothetical protein MVEN_01475700 [Mycena venus]|uniref:Uncharacterized protein n=1 Tax=Mycena venus TaxID=2733690 RepID=A0A8H6XSE8_9AGAR|nr:hypothetical protein MVEN_01475700 [Mycena venus]
MGPPITSRITSSSRIKILYRSSIPTLTLYFKPKQNADTTRTLCPPPSLPPTSSPSTPVSTSNILVFTGLILVVLLVSIFVAVRRRQTQQANRRAITLYDDPPPSSTAPNRPLHHDAHLTGAWAAEAPTWHSIQPLAVQTPFQQQQTQKHGQGRWPTIKLSGIHPSASLSSRSEASVDATTSPTLLNEFPENYFERHLQIAVLISMPLPPGPEVGDSLLSRDIADSNLAIGVADTLFPTS